MTVMFGGRATLGIAVTGTAFNAGYRHYVHGHLSTSNDRVASAVLSSPAAGQQAAASAGTSAHSYLDVLASAAGLGWAIALLVMSLAFALVFVGFWLWHPRTAATTVSAPMIVTRGMKGDSPSISR